MNSVLKFQPNEPTEIALAFPQGKITPSNYGADQVMFTLEYPPEHITFLDLHAAASLRQLDPARGERFVICKRKGAERNSPVKWDFWLTPDAEKARAAREAGVDLKKDGRPAWGGNAPEQPGGDYAERPNTGNLARAGKPLQMPSPAADAPTLLERQLEASLAEVGRLKAAKAEVERLKAEAAAALAPTPAAAPRPIVTQMEDALKTAVAAAFAATEYARSIGYTEMPRFEGDDLRAMACTIMIGQQQARRQ